MDTIWNTAFGIDINMQNNPNNPYFNKCESHFSSAVHFNFGLFLLSITLII